MLSLDSLSIYRKIDIASAKPSLEERDEIDHFGIDIVYPDEPFSVSDFIDIYKEAEAHASSSGKNLIIAGGSSFYLKILLSGISPLPKISGNTAKTVEELMKNTTEAYRYLKTIAPEHSLSISPSDRYRIEKSLLIAIETGLAPDEYFKSNPPIPIISSEIDIYETVIAKEELKERVARRTKNMIERGLIDEVASLEYEYGRFPKPMKSIGIKEVLDYFDGLYGVDTMEEKININTMRLAKRQRTFNRTQFENLFRGSVKDLEREILSVL